MLKMKEKETIKEYFDKLIKVINQLRLIRKELINRKITNNILISLFEKFESKIASLKDSKDITRLIVTKLVNTLQAQ